MLINHRHRIIHNTLPNCGHALDVSAGLGVVHVSAEALVEVLDQLGVQLVGAREDQVAAGGDRPLAHGLPLGAQLRDERGEDAGVEAAQDVPEARQQVGHDIQGLQLDGDVFLLQMGEWKRVQFGSVGIPYSFYGRGQTSGDALADVAREAARCLRQLCDDRLQADAGDVSQLLLVGYHVGAQSLDYSFHLVFLDFVHQRPQAAK